MKMRGISYFYLIIMVIMLVIIGLSLRMEYFASKLLPLVFSSTVFVLAAIGLGREILTKEKSGATVAGGEAGKQEESRESWRGSLVAGAWVAGFFLVIYLLGFIIAIPLFVLSYMKLHGTRWVVAIVFAVLASALIYGGFELALKVNLYKGLVFG